MSRSYGDKWMTGVITTFYLDGEEKSMMIFNRVCLEDVTIHDKEDNIFELKKGETYLTSIEEEDKVTVLSQHWVILPVSLFSEGERML